MLCPFKFYAMSLPLPSVVVLKNAQRCTVRQSCNVLINLIENSCFSLQSKCSMFRGVILCLCLNLTYANVVRFPRELDRHGVAFLVPYLVILLFIGLPIILLEIALGQFLGQGSAHSWRASPILRGKYIAISVNDFGCKYIKENLHFTGASIVGRLASWLGTITISLQGVLGMVYIGEILVKSVPFSQCQVNTF